MEDHEEHPGCTCGGVCQITGTCGKHLLKEKEAEAKSLEGKAVEGKAVEGSGEWELRPVAEGEP